MEVVKHLVARCVTCCYDGEGKKRKLFLLCVDILQNFFLLLLLFIYFFLKPNLKFHS